MSGPDPLTAVPEAGSEAEIAGTPGGSPSFEAPPTIPRPVSSDMGVLGKKWTLSLLNHIASEKQPSFTQLLEAHDSLSHRILWVRLTQLREEGYVERSHAERGPWRVTYALTEKGRHAVQIARLHSELLRKFCE